MKTLIALLTILCLLAPCALAEQTRTETIMLEGMEEQISLVSFASASGYTLWYDPSSLMPVESDAESIDSFVPSDPEAIEGVSLTIRTVPLEGADFEQICEQNLKSLQEKKVDCLTVDPPALPGALDIQAVCGTYDDMILDSYIVKTERAIYEILINYPMEAAEGYGSRINQFLQWIENL